ncbi:copper amine oxidase N-terminal domain-containing protein [Paenibacillus sp. FSL K6-2441]|uniref:copper amine oxidase N-terminal domain-containing protein n=1 Tax=Paenibacillus sp. FSL K6-2441 TaxID=2954679 RepID=UPI0030D76A21
MRFLKKIWASLLAALLIIPIFQQTTAQAATPISIYIDGNRLTTDQAPVIISGRVMLPLRAIFEALDAKVNYNQTLKTVTAYKDGTTITLKLMSRSATINNETVLLDVPAQSIKGRTMVPVRFVSEALGQQVGWSNSAKIVTINSGFGSGGSGGSDSGSDPSPVAYVTARDVGNYGDGRDLQISFSKSSNESRVEQYRVMIVKASNASSFNLAAAQKVGSANYTSLSPSGSDLSLTLSASARDVDGAAIREDQSYVAYVLVIGKGNSANTLSNPSPAFTLTNTVSVAAPSNVKVSDVSDYGDGRDLSVTFTRAQNESNIANYRVFVVKTKDASSFTLSTANNLPSSYSTLVSKSGSGSTLTGQLASSARDTSGELIKNGVSYTVFVLSVSNNTGYSNKLSSGSSAITLAQGSIIAPVITKVEDWNDYGDGRDLRVSFNRISDETRISSYRIFVVKASDYANFSLAKANLVSSANYTQVNKTGSNITSYALSSNAQDVDGATIRNGVSYRVFVMAVGTGAYAGTNTLSSASAAITLTNGSTVDMVSNVTVEDVSDYGDGRDLRVTFTRAANETYISNYRILVVKTSDANNFTLAKANNVGSANYTTVSKSGYTLSTILKSGARDVDGATIRNGVSYRVFVLSVASSGYNLSNALSSYSSPITLSNNMVSAVLNLSAADVSDYGDGRDLRVTFTRAANETYISYYKVLVVKASKTGSFNLNAANSSNYYTTVNKNGATLTVNLNGAKDTDGEAIRNGVPYRVYVLSVAASGGGSNVLSGYSNEVTLVNSTALQPLSVSADVTGSGYSYSDIVVSFNKQPNESNVEEYRIMVVPAANVSSFNLEYANTVTLEDNYTAVKPNGRNIQVSLGKPNTAYGVPLDANTTYQVFVLTVAKSGSGMTNLLSGPSGQVKLKVDPSTVPVSAATDVSAVVNGSGIEVVFSKPSNDQSISRYLVIAVPTSGASGIVASESYQGAAISKSGPYSAVLDKDYQGNLLDLENNTYNVYVITVPDMSSSTNYAITGPISVTTPATP